MDGLESIALAVAHLEQAREQQHQQDASQRTSSPKTSPDHADGNEDAASKEGRHSPIEKSRGTLDSPSDLSASAGSIPARSSFADSTARMVSSDSFNSQAQPTGASSPANNTAAPLPVVSPSASTLTSSSSSSIESLDDAGPPPGTSAADLVIHELPPPPSPTEVIASVLDNDVLCGRGGETNHHPGNIKYRSLVKCYQPLYIASKRRDKPRIAQKIVFTIRQRGGRFLKKDVRTNTWRDVGNTKAREKTSQALREGAPELRHGTGESEGGGSTPSPVPPVSSVSPPTVMAPAGAGSSMARIPHLEFQHQQQQSAAAMGLAAAALFMNPRGPLDFDHAASLKTMLPGLAELPLHASQQKALLLNHLQQQPRNILSAAVSPEAFASAGSAESAAALSGAKRESEETAPPKFRGPRLKRLKSRLESGCM